MTDSHLFMISFSTNGEHFSTNEEHLLDKQGTLPDISGTFLRG